VGFSIAFPRSRFERFRDDARTDSGSENSPLDVDESRRTRETVTNARRPAPRPSYRRNRVRCVVAARSTIYLRATRGSQGAVRFAPITANARLDCRRGCRRRYRLDEIKKKNKNEQKKVFNTQRPKGRQLNCYRSRWGGRCRRD